jgi:hypothetical protein
MRLTLIAAALIVAAPAYAGDGWLTMETIDESRARHSAENYRYYQQHGVPLGGYPEALGDPAPRGTERPGFITRDSAGRSYGYGNAPSRQRGSLRD